MVTKMTNEKQKADAALDRAAQKSKIDLFLRELQATDFEDYNVIRDRVAAIVEELEMEAAELTVFDIYELCSQIDEDVEGRYEDEQNVGLNVDLTLMAQTKTPNPTRSAGSTPAQGFMKKEIKNRKDRKMKVRDLIEMLAKCDWNSEVTCLDDESHEMSAVDKEINEIGPHEIVTISQCTKTGTRIVYSAI